MKREFEDEFEASGNGKRPGIFMAVLAIHIVAIMCISAYHVLKGNEVAGGEMEDAIGAQSMAVSALETHVEPVAGLLTGLTADKAQEPEKAKESVVAPDPRVEASREQASETQIPRTPLAPVNPPSRENSEASATDLTAKTHTVVPGDTLGAIASRYGASVADLKRLNQLDSDLIRVGQVLTLRGSDERQGAVQKPVESDDVRSEQAINQYRVQPGDTLWSISRQFNASLEKILRENGLKDATRIQAGTILKVPSTGPQKSTNTNKPMYQPPKTPGLRLTSVAMKE